MKASKKTVKKATAERVKAETIRSRKENALYINSVIWKGNAKLLDYDNPETGRKTRYTQFNLRPLLDCPGKSAGCAAVCYATAGHHKRTSVKVNRERSRAAAERNDFSAAMIYTIETGFKTERYNGKFMEFRIHESGDFYSLDYLKKWVVVFDHYMTADNISFCFYTKSFQFLLDLSPAEKAIVNGCLERGTVAMSLSLDDTTTPAQLARAMEVKKQFPLANIYYCTENVPAGADKCDCENCAKCANCTHTTGKKVYVKIHSATEKQIDKFRKNARNEK